MKPFGPEPALERTISKRGGSTASKTLCKLSIAKIQQGNPREARRIVSNYGMEYGPKNCCFSFGHFPSLDHRPSATRCESTKSTSQTDRQRNLYRIGMR